MWVLSGPFDGTEGDLSFEKSKFLKPGKRYVFGRRDTALVVNNKKVSHTHATFMIGDYSVADVTDPSTRPSIQVHNTRNRPMSYERNGQTLPIGPSSTIELQSDDLLHPFNTLSLRLRWHPVCCYMSNPPTELSNDCAGLGVHLVQTLHPDVTHYVTSAISLTPSTTLSLVSGCQFATPEWVEELIRLSKGVGDVAPLESNFELPPISKFQPQLSHSLPPSLQHRHLWERNDKRRVICSGYHFIVLSSKEERGDPVQSLLLRTGAHFTTCPADAERSTFRRVLSKNTTQDLVIIVADELAKDMAGERWIALRQEAQNFSRNLILQKHVLEAVINMDLSPLSAVVSSKELNKSHKSPNISPKPLVNITSLCADQVHLSESDQTTKGRLNPPSPTLPQVPPSQIPSEMELVPERPRRHLTRRAGTVMNLPVLGDDSTIIDVTQSVLAAPESMPPPPNMPILGVDFDASLPLRSSRLKRRAGKAEMNPLPQNPDETLHAEPPLKKFKALFEESDPDRLSQTEANTFNGASPPPMVAEIQNLDPNETQTLSNIPTSSSTQVFEDEAPAQESNTFSGSKRHFDHSGDAQGDISVRATKRRQIDTLARTKQPYRAPTETTTSQNPSQTVPGSFFGQPDVDDRFLKAVASVKQSSKNVDSFDREFDGLRISKPDMQRDVREKEWTVLEDFGDERNIRGNFMVIVEMEVFKKGLDQAVVRRGNERGDWEGRSDFKKFRQKNPLEQRKAVDLTVSHGNDYGIGTAYWKANSQNQTRRADATYDLEMPTQVKNKALPVPMEDSDQDEDELPPRTSRKQSQLRSGLGANQGTTRPVVRGKRELDPLFLDSGDEKMMVDNVDSRYSQESDEEIPTLTSASSSKVAKSQDTRKRKNPPAIIIDDDSDNGATFRGYESKGKVRTR